MPKSLIKLTGNLESAPFINSNKNSSLMNSNFNSKSSSNNSNSKFIMSPPLPPMTSLNQHAQQQHQSQHHHHINNINNQFSSSQDPNEFKPSIAYLNSNLRFINNNSNTYQSNNDNTNQINHSQQRLIATQLLSEIQSQMQQQQQQAAQNNYNLHQHQQQQHHHQFNHQHQFNQHHQAHNNSYNLDPNNNTLFNKISTSQINKSIGGVINNLINSTISHQQQQQQQQQQQANNYSNGNTTNSMLNSALNSYNSMNSSSISNLQNCNNNNNNNNNNYGLDETKCHVCGDKSTGSHFGGISCESCKAFFRRSVQRNRFEDYKCSYSGECKMNTNTRKICQFCRYKQCLSIGMRPKWVLSDDERHQKYGSRRKNKTKLLESPSSVSSLTPSTPPSKLNVTEEISMESTSLKKEIISNPLSVNSISSETQFNANNNYNNNSDNNQNNNSVNNNNNNNNNKNNDSNSSLNKHFLSSSSSNSDELLARSNNNSTEIFSSTTNSDTDASPQQQQPPQQQQTTTSRDSSANNSNQNNESESSQSPSLSRIDTSKLGIDDIDMSNLNLNLFEKDLIDRLSIAFYHSRKYNAVDLNVQKKLAVLFQTQNNRNLKKMSKVILANFIVQPVKRVITFAKLLHDFRKLDISDQMCLLQGGSMEIFICSSSSLYDQMANKLVNVVSKDRNIEGNDNSNVQLDILRLIWSEAIFEKTIQFFKSMSELKLDEATLILFIPLILFSPDRLDLEDRKRVFLIQSKFSFLLKKYMIWKYGFNAATIKLYNKLLLKLMELRTLREMHSSILLDAESSRLEPFSLALINSHRDENTKFKSNKETLETDTEPRTTIKIEPNDKNELEIIDNENENDQIMLNTTKDTFDEEDTDKSPKNSPHHNHHKIEAIEEDSCITDSSKPNSNHHFSDNTSILTPKSMALSTTNSGQISSYSSVSSHNQQLSPTPQSNETNNFSNCDSDY